jgi:Histone methylation protein DOT1
LTGELGGNASGGAIYGELTQGSMQTMVNLMIEHTNFGPSSIFIDVGAGVGKPNLHVLQHSGVQFLYGIEMIREQWLLSLVSLKAVLEQTEKNSACHGTD